MGVLHPHPSLPGEYLSREYVTNPVSRAVNLVKTRIMPTAVNENWVNP